MTMLGTDARQGLLNTLQARCRYVSLHIGPLEGNEVVSGYYHRQQVTWQDGRNEAEIRFVVPNCRVVGLGYWDSGTGGTFQGGGPTEAVVCDDGDYYVIPAGRLRLRVVTA